MNIKTENSILMTLLIMLFLVVMACTFTSCKSKQKVTTQEREVRIDTVTVVQKVTDTIEKEKIVTVTLPASSDQVVEDPCDDQGNLKPINSTIKSGGNEITVYSREGKLYIRSKIDSLQSTSEKEYRSRLVQDSIHIRQQLEKEFRQVDKTTVYTWPWWVYALIIYGIVSTALNLYQKFRIL